MIRELLREGLSVSEVARRVVSAAEAVILYIEDGCFFRIAVTKPSTGWRRTNRI
jgi:hypothetical protein